jgi:photosystem II stability/assembly factor-like uncharacterized protein
MNISTLPGAAFLIPVLCSLLLCPQDSSRLTWTNIGPGGGGWLSAITIVNDQANTVYVGCDVGGMYKSTDNGRSWAIKNSGLSDYYVQDIAYDPRDPQTLYVATRGGVFKSNNGGDHWTLKRTGFPPETPYSYSAPVSDIVVDPVHPETIYAGIGIIRAGYEQDSAHWQNVDPGSKGAIFKSINGAENWTLIRQTGIDPTAMIYSLAIDPRTTTTLYAATDHGVYKSMDSGANWQGINSGLPHQQAMTLVIDPLTPATLYVTMWAQPGSATWQGGVYKSVNGGQSWQEKNYGLPREMGSEYGLTSNYPVLVIDQHNPQTLYVGNTPWTPDPGVYKTTDGGDHWAWVTDEDQPDGNMDPGWITEHGISVKCLAISPNNPELLYFGTSVHLFQSVNGGQSWEQAYTRPGRQGSWQGTGLETTCVGDIAVDPTDPDTIYVGYWDMGFLKSTDGGASFKRITQGMGEEYASNTFSIVVDPADPATLYAAAGWWEENRGGVITSHDHGETWTPITTGLPDATVWSIALDPSSPVAARTLYAASYQHGIYKTADGGQSWRAMNTGLGVAGNLQVRSIALDPDNPQILYAGIEAKETDNSEQTIQGGIFKSSDGGGHWSRIDTNTPQLSVWDIEVVPGHANTIYTAVSSEYDHTLQQTFPGGVYKSRDGGRSWIRMSGDFGSEENLDVVAIALHPAQPERLYAVTADAPYHDQSSGRGIFRSIDGGATWSAINNGLGILSLNAIAIAPSNPFLLFAGSNGNGVFRALDRQ